MARFGSFSSPTFAFGTPVGIVKPLDNKIPQFDPELESAKDLTDAQRKALQSEVQGLAATLILARDFKP